jgi:hypothetical protein
MTTTPPPIPEELHPAAAPHAPALPVPQRPDVPATARAQRWDRAEVLRVLITDEVVGREATTLRTRRKAAAFPTGKTLASWRPDESSIPEPTQNALTSLERIGRHENLLVAGPSHFVEALAHVAIEKDLRVSWFTLEALTTTLGHGGAKRCHGRGRFVTADAFVYWFTANHGRQGLVDWSSMSPETASP